jgi:hypothetical protein
VSLFIWLLPLDLSSMGDSTSSYAIAGIALRVLEAFKLHHHNKVETPSVGTVVSRLEYLKRYTLLLLYFLGMEITISDNLDYEKV